MATAQPLPRMSRLGIFSSRHGSSKPGPQSPLPTEPEEEEEDWYIPYNGPYEPPKRRTDETRDSWGELLNGLLSDDERRGRDGRDGRSSHAATAPEADTRSRAVSGASRLTHSTGPANQSRRNTAARNHQHPQQRVSAVSYVNHTQSGGVGESPMPVERTASQPVPSTSQLHLQPTVSRRASLASIFTFGRKSLRLSASMDNLAQDRNQTRSRSNSHVDPSSQNLHPSPGRPRANTAADSSSPQPRLSVEDEYYNTYYSTLLATPGRGNEPTLSSEAGGSMRSHPYAYAFPSSHAEPQSAPPVVDKGKGRLLVPRITLLDPRGPKVPAYLKPSPRNSLLKASMSTPNLRNLPKGKHKWLAAETWCDALILPRPRFAMRLIDEGASSGRIVSPPPSPLGSDHRPDPNVSIQPRPGPSLQKALKKARSMGTLMSSSPAPSQSGRHEVAPSPSAQPSPAQEDQTPGRPPRPKSFALDDLALLSPVPSLSKVLEDGRQLEQDRREWQSQANRSFLDRRAGTISRSRSKSIGDPRSRSRARSKEGERKAFEALAERTLLGNQMKLPTIHIRAPSAAKSRHGHSRSQSLNHTYSQTQTQTHSQDHTHSSTAQTHASPFKSFTRSATVRTRSHAHSNSLGRSLSSKSLSGESGASGPGHTHVRSHSLGKTAFKLVLSTASNAAAFCGLTGSANERTVSMMNDEKAVALEGALQSPGTRVIRLQDQIRAEDGRGDVDTTLAMSPSAALAMVTRTAASPTPSGLSGSAEAVGIAISPPSDDHSRPYHSGREAIRLPAHPYAQSPPYMSSPLSHPVDTQLSPVRENPQNDSAANESLVNRNRQPVLIHPYSQPTHPYATTPHSQIRPANIQVIQVPPQNARMYAELTPGHVREFAPDVIRYSPDIPTPGIVHGPRPQPPPVSNVSHGHPYGPASKRTSELGFGEALMHTMRRASVDSGLGTSETGGHDDMTNWADRAGEVSPDAVVDDIVRIHAVPQSPQKQPRLFGPRPLPANHSPIGSVTHKPTTSPENLSPAGMRRTTSAGPRPGLARNENSSGSSPGMISHDSSPPLSARFINTSDDLDRFRDLFYRPDRQSKTTDSGSRPSMGSTRPSGSIILDVGSQRSTRSGLSTLARQLSEDLEELRQEFGPAEGEQEEQRWGRRHGGLRGPRPDDMRDDPNVVLAQLSASSSDRGMSHSPMRLPIDTTFVNPVTNIPEDVESSRASSVLQLSPVQDDDLAEHFRFGEVEAVSTPPIINTPHRFSTELSLVGHAEPDSRLLNVLTGDMRPFSLSDDALLSPMTPYTRSSYRTSGTDTSRMSGLSDFPAPPTLFLPSHNRQTRDFDRPRLEREPSLATFGRSEDEYTIGQAL